ncbi:MAG TPA: class I SAM-dependent methyltransferase [Ramlibacter sp.]|uniref:class I SAM-dependent methyltransferase n=1 Tax=Ramlibacter sp. TaxID=1917967 RepID=UPI002CDCAC2B|nr:class I SAM-dependent methyltransferase [Ramlibacter sp.]HVZ42168.1 class I SAM-dependent methyltransferase [Ramlibacter sp.]
MFTREMRESETDADVLADPRLGDASYVESFGYEWTRIDGFADREVLAHGHLFGRFLLPRDFFRGKSVVDVGCGNGRIGRIVAPQCERYVGVDLSEAIYAFPKYIRRPREFVLVRASGTDLPLADRMSDATICWGALHHMDDPDRALDELLRVTKPRGTILIYVYPPAFAWRRNISFYLRGLPPDSAHSITARISDALDRWRDVDPFYAELLATQLALSFKPSREWQQFQWFDGVTPRYHHDIEERVAERVRKSARKVERLWPGCLKIER